MYNLYGHLQKVVPRQVANVIMVVWYLVILCGVVVLAFQPTAQFNYLNL